MPSPGFLGLANPARSLSGFVVRAMVCVAVCVLLWSLVSAWLSYPVGIVGSWLLETAAPMWVRSVKTVGSLLEVQTTVEVMVPNSGGRKGEIVIEANPARYAYGLPLLFGLLLASGSRRVARYLAGYLLLLPAQVFSLVSFVLMQIVLSAQGDRVALKTGNLELDAIAYASQLGALIIPTVAPLAIWLFLERKQLESLLQTRET